MEGYGRLSKDGQEFVIDRPDLPEPWFNKLSNGRYSVELAQTGQAKIIFDGKERHDGWRYLYIRDLDSSDYWSLTWHPVHASFDQYECHYRPDENQYRTSRNQIEASAAVFTVNKLDGEIWEIELGNKGKKKRRLVLFFVASLPSDVREVELVKDLVIGQRRSDSSSSYFLGASRSLTSWDGQIESFFGPYGSSAAPQAVIDGKSQRSRAQGEPALMAISFQIALGSSSSTKFQVWTGVTDNLAQTRRALGELRLVEAVTKAKAKGEAERQLLENQIMGRLPDSSTSHLFNTWLKHQALTTLGPDGSFNFDLMMTLIIFGQLDEIELLNLLGNQTKDGRYDNLPTTIKLIRLLCYQAQETGNLKFFNQSASFADGGEGSVLQHLVRALTYLTRQLSSRHLATVSAGNDAELESTVLTGQVAYVLRQVLPILEHFNEHTLVDQYTSLIEKMKGSVEKYLKSGRYYSAGLHSAKGRIGGKKQPRQVDLASQAWLVISGLISSERGKMALSSAEKALATNYGLLNFAPAYPVPVEDGWVDSQDSPGTGTNSTITLEATTALIWAKTLLGLGNSAERHWQSVNPLERFRQPLSFAAEPFILPEFIYGPDHQRFGRAAGGWGSDNAGGLWRVMLEQVCGIQPQLGGLKIDPCLPKEWRQVEITRRFRGADYHIRIHNPFGVSKGVDRVIVDGVRLTGSVIRPFAGGNHFIEVTLG